MVVMLRGGRRCVGHGRALSHGCRALSPLRRRQPILWPVPYGAIGRLLSGPPLRSPRASLLVDRCHRLLQRERLSLGRRQRVEELLVRLAPRALFVGLLLRRGVRAVLLTVLPQLAQLIRNARGAAAAALLRLCRWRSTRGLLLLRLLRRRRRVRLGVLLLWLRSGGVDDEDGVAE